VPGARPHHEPRAGQETSPPIPQWLLEAVAVRDAAGGLFEDGEADEHGAENTGVELNTSTHVDLRRPTMNRGNTSSKDMGVTAVTSRKGFGISR